VNEAGPVLLDEHSEWLEADGMGGYASGNAVGIRTRRYHALLLIARTPPTGRLVLVNGFDAWIEMGEQRWPISTQRYLPDVRHPDGATRIEFFRTDPWPTWRYRLDDGLAVQQEILVPHRLRTVGVRWTLMGSRRRGEGGAGREDDAAVYLVVRPFLSGRPMHALHHENPDFRFAATPCEGGVGWRPYDPGPLIRALSNGEYIHKPLWYRDFLYSEERARGLDFTEDLASPGVFRWELSAGEAVWLLSAEMGETALSEARPPATGDAVVATLRRLRAAERMRRRRFPSRLHRAADAYLVRRGDGRTIIAGYPWFADWGRDAFIALRGLCLSTGRLDEAREILLAWAGAESEGMLPNRFPERGGDPEFNSVDAALWFVVAVDAYHTAMRFARRRIFRRHSAPLEGTISRILSGYAAGTRHGIRADDDGLLAAGEPGLQLTWMDAKVGSHVVTPRIGKPVEIQALWLNALSIGGHLDDRWREPFERGRRSFEKRFWNEADRCLFDTVDVDHRPGTVDPALRPNQILAVGGLPLVLLAPWRARQVVAAVQERLWTPLGLRTLAPGEDAYRPRYKGGVAERDGAYHQGTVWPWLLGPFVEAWIRTRRGQHPRAVREAARRRFLEPVLAHLDEAGLGHVSEIVDAEPPFTPRGCPFQAWSVAEALRISVDMLGPLDAASR